MVSKLGGGWGGYRSLCVSIGADLSDSCQEVPLDSDLAALYQVLTNNLYLAVRCNISYFPEDFMFNQAPKTRKL